MTVSGQLSDAVPARGEAAALDCFSRALEHERRGELDRAVACYRRAVEIEPQHRDAWINLGGALGALGRWDEAIGCYRRAVAIDPGHALAHYNLANSLAFRGRLEEAVAGYRRALELVPDEVNALNNLGNVLRMRGEVGEAAACFRRAVEVAPGYALAHYNLANVLNDGGDHAGAESGYRRALELAPANANIRNNLGNVLAAQGRAEDAADCYRQALAIAPGHAQAQDNLGRVLRGRVRAHVDLASGLFRGGNLDEAMRWYRRALELEPENASARHGLAEALARQGKLLARRGKLKEAIEICREAAAVDPTEARLHYTLGVLLARRKKHADAAESFRRSTEIDPTNVEAHVELGRALLHLTKAEAATAAFRRAVELDPASAKAQEELGGVFAAQGQNDAAAAAFRRSLELGPDRVHVYYHLAQHDAIALTAHEVSAMERLIAEGRASGAGEIDICFALGRAHQALGGYDRAFEYFARGNRLKRATVDYDIAKEEEKINRRIAVFDDALLARFAGCGYPSEQPIFIFGMHRSGTTLVEQILASHSWVHGGGEVNVVEAIADALTKLRHVRGPFPEAVGKLRPQDVHRLGRRYVDFMAKLAPEARRITDKWNVNYKLLGFIRILLPNAKLVHCRRNPVDTCWSSFTRLFPGPWAYDLTELGQAYRFYDRIMRHWHAVLPGQILDVQYEELVADQVGVTKRLIEFCGLPWEDACLAFHQTERTVRTPSVSQVRRPIYKSAVERWRAYERHLGPLLEALGPLAHEASGRIAAPGGGAAAHSEIARREGA